MCARACGVADERRTAQCLVETNLKGIWSIPLAEEGATTDERTGVGVCADVERGASSLKSDEFRQ